MGQLDSGNAAWILTSASLVFLMTPGVAFFYGGMVRAKAVLNMMIMEAAALSVTMIMWVLWGWSIAYAGTSVGGIFGDPATGFLLKDTEPETLLNSIRTVYQGNAIIAPSATKRLIEKMMGGDFAGTAAAAPVSATSASASTATMYTDPELDELTDREREIVTLRYGLGGRMPRTQREVAKKLGISRSYVSRIEKRALQKLEEALGERE